MTDRELLELAAKAAGVPAYWSDDGSIQQRPLFVVKAGGAMGTMPYECPWNPLLDDADALRLLVRLRLPLDYSSHSWGELNPATTCGQYWDRNESCHYPFRVAHNGDPYAATRRAITRAAAEIGKAMP